jgi:anti-anti-sigma regulatory factor
VLKITIVETTTDRRWIVQGRLVGPWVSELRTTWKNAHRAHDERACIIDLNDVMFIDKSGERLLRAISKKGAQLIARGMYVKHVLEQLKSGRTEEK